MVGLTPTRSDPILAGPLQNASAMSEAPFRERAAAAAGEGRGFVLRDGVLEVPGALRLHHGGECRSLRVAWRLEGTDSAPVVVALGGISAHRRVAAMPGQEPGWWQALVGIDLAVPLEHYRVLSFDYIGSNGGSTGPSNGELFPSVSTYDQADALLRLLNHLGLRSVRAIVGASYGGMVGLAFAERYPDRIERLAVISAADRPHPMATAWRSIQREVIRFALEQGEPARGVDIARRLAMTTYRSAEEFSARFDSVAKQELGRFIFPVEHYLSARGSEYTRRQTPESFLALSESIDLHRIDATSVQIPVLAIAIREDQLVPVSDMRAMAARLPRVQLHELSSVFGHDAFLKEANQLRALLPAFLEVNP